MAAWTRRRAQTRIAWGGVAHRPWRASALEARLGTDLDEESVREACAAELADAATWQGNAFKPAMVTGATVEACSDAGRRQRRRIR